VLDTFLNTTIYLEPLNLFLYTWRFLEIIEKEEKVRILKPFYRWFSAVIIFVLPIAFYATFVVYLIDTGRYFEYFFQGKRAEVELYSHRKDVLRSVIGYLALTCNLISCTTIGLLLRLFSKMTRQVSFGRDAVETKQKLNQTVTISHICLTLLYTITSVFYFNVPYTDGQGTVATTFKTEAVWTLIGCFCDLFLICMIWFIMNNKQQQVLLQDGHHSYPILEVVKLPNYSISDINISENEEEDKSVNVSYSLSFRVSENMIAQFFSQIEGPDRNWAQENSEYYREPIQSPVLFSYQSDLA
jgi:hypothetical protein